jgi:hypothetical protein
MKAAEIQNTPDACCPLCQRKMDKVFVADGSEKKEASMAKFNRALDMVK